MTRQDPQPTRPALACRVAKLSPAARRPGSGCLLERRASELTQPGAGLNGFLFQPQRREMGGKALGFPCLPKSTGTGHLRLPSGLLGRLNSLTELSDSLKNMLRGPDFMTECIYPGSEEIPNLVGFFPSPAQERQRALGLPARSKVVHIGFNRVCSESHLPGSREIPT